METSLAKPRINLGLRGFVALTLFACALIFPPAFAFRALLPVGLFGAFLCVPLLFQAFRTGRDGLWRMGLIVAFGTFTVSLLGEVALAQLNANLVFVLLQFIVVLFAVEFGQFVRNQTYAESVSRGEQRTPTGEIGRERSRLTTVAVLLAASFVLSLAFLELGSFLGSAIPLLSDISLYVVIVTVALPLLLALGNGFEGKRLGEDFGD